MKRHVAAIRSIPMVLLCGITYAYTADYMTSKALAPLAGPNYTPVSSQESIGFYGTDLGFTAKHNGQLRIVFGDSWAAQLTPTLLGNPLGDDCQGTICLQSSDSCPSGGVPLSTGTEVEAYTGMGSPFWDNEGPPLVFATNLKSQVAPLNVRDSGGGVFSPVLDMGPLKTPVTVFSNAMLGASSGFYGIFFRNVAISCTADSSCGGDWTCDTDLGMNGEAACNPSTTLGCKSLPGMGVCVDTGSPRYNGSDLQGRLRGAVLVHRVGNADPDQDHVYYTRAWETHRFINPTATTVNAYTITGITGESVVGDPFPPDGTTTGKEKVFLWGRPSFAGVEGEDAKLYFAVVDMPSYDSDADFAWQPQYYSGLDGSNNPTFSTVETDAVPLDLSGAGGDATEEVQDIANQHSVRYLPEIGEWVMIYGGDLDPELYELFSQGQGQLLMPDANGAVKIRFAQDPWGPWSEPQDLVHASDIDTGAGPEYEPGGSLFHEQCPNTGPGSPCIQGELYHLFILGNPQSPGFFYGANLIQEWTVAKGGGEVDIYFNLSTWAPYQVTLFKSTLFP